jgi:hexosaminidase
MQIIFYLLFLTGLSQALNSPQTDLLLLPQPQSLKWEGEWIQNNPQTEQEFKKYFSTPESLSFITLEAGKLAPEEYQLSITSISVAGNKSPKVHIRYGGLAGKQYALTTFLMLQQSREGFLPLVTVLDKPAFSWRGLHLDVSRHFHEVKNIKKLLTVMSKFKLNKFHWHLVDDQGWRIEIKKYPKLTEVGGYRVDRSNQKWNERTPATKLEEAKYGGYYTHGQIKEIVQHATDLNIEVIPEIELPAHVSSAIAAYPELSCSKDTIQVPTGGIWPVKNLYCPSKAIVWDFLFDVFDEVSTLFPSKWIHIGGDEAHYEQWEADSSISFQMKALGLETHADLQAWMNHKIADYLRAKGKSIIGWDEILESGQKLGSPKDAAVMVWRDSKWAYEAAKAGHSVILSPSNFMYFDHYQDLGPYEPEAIGHFTSLRDVWEYQPYKQVSLKNKHADLKENSWKQRILGIQANLWTEYMPDWKKVEYMLFPRFFALAERAWVGEQEFESPMQKELAWKNFVGRTHYHRMSIESQVYSQGHEIKPELTLFPTVGSIQLSIDSTQYHFLRNFGELKVAVYLTAMDKEFTGFGKSIQVDSSNIYTLTDSTSIEITGVKRISAYIQKRDEPYFMNPYVKISNPIQNGYSSKLYDKVIYAHKALGAPIHFIKIPSTKFNDKKALVNGTKGSLNFSDGEWVGFEEDSLNFEIQLGQVKSWNVVKLAFLNDPVSWVFAPKLVRVYGTTSEDKEVLIKEISYEKFWKSEPRFNKQILNPSVTIPLKMKIEKIRVEVVPMGKCPKGHSGEGGKAWTFLGEITVL